MIASPSVWLCVTSATASPPPEASGLVGRVDQREPVGNPGQAEQALNLLGSADHREPPSGLDRLLMRPDQHAQPRRIHEFELPEIDDHRFNSGVHAAVELLLQRWARGEVQLPGDPDYHRLIPLPELDLKVALHGAAGY